MPSFHAPVSSTSSQLSAFRASTNILILTLPRLSFETGSVSHRIRRDCRAGSGLSARCGATNDGV
jgi:hypothetical protein